MIRLLARLHGVEASEASQSTSARRSAVVGLITSGVVIAHLAALGVGGAFLFVRSGEGYSTGETVMLVVLAGIAVLALRRALRLFRARSTAGTDVLDVRSIDEPTTGVQP